MSELKRMKREYKLEVVRKWIYISAFSFLLFIGITLLFINTVYSHVTNQSHVESVLEETKSVSAQQIEGNKDVIENTFNSESNIKISSQRSLPDSTNESSNTISYNFKAIKPVSSMASDKKLNTNFVIGQLYIPDIELNLPILEGISNENLYNGAGTLKPNQKFGEGNFAVASLNIREKDYLFSNLRQLRKGNSLYATDKQIIYEYEISKVTETNEDIDQSIKDDESKIITLITHSEDNKGSHIIVQADLKYSYSFDKASKELSKVFLPK